MIGKVVETVKTYTVSGLTEVQTVDFFKDVTVTFEGLSGSGNAVITVNSDSEIVNSCEFDSHKLGLSNGDDFVVEISNIEELLDSYAVIPLETSKTYKVTGLSKLVTSVDEIPVDTIKEFADRFVKEKNESIEDDFMFSYSDAEYYGSYFCTKTGNGNHFWEPENKICIYVQYDVYKDGEFSATIYVPLVFEDVTVNQDRELNLTYEDGGGNFFRMK